MSMIFYPHFMGSPSRYYKWDDSDVILSIIVTADMSVYHVAAVWRHGFTYACKQ